ncbi:hypothetical protein [Gottschalkia acidurici]|uniref:hypothetical protein n=1 Tax=Clostridium acidurici TaxID=1556 RepID=UPI00031B228E|nr:hypothetical protein [Gottschalkia acidurici]
MDILIKNEEKPVLDEIVRIIKQSSIQKQQLILTHLEGFNQGYVYRKMEEIKQRDREKESA